MGVDYHVYMGPFITCRQRDAVRDEERYGCVNPDCSEFRKKKDTRRFAFCGSCGDAHQTFIVKVKRDVSHYDIVGDAFSRADSQAYGGGADGSVTLVPMRQAGRHRAFLRSPMYDSGWTEIVHDMVLSEKAWFSDVFREEIQKIRDHFDDVTIRWGLIMFAS